MENSGIVNNHKYITLLGEVVYRGVPVPSKKNKYIKIGFFGVKCVISDRQSNGTYKDIADYFSIRTFSEKSLISIREGYLISCQIKRVSNLWMDKATNKPKLKQEYDFDPETSKRNHPIGWSLFVFESWDLVGEIQIIDSSKNLEEIDAHNKEFEHTDMPFKANSDQYNDLSNEYDQTDDLPF